MSWLQYAPLYPCVQGYPDTDNALFAGSPGRRPLVVALRGPYIGAMNTQSTTSTEQSSLSNSPHHAVFATAANGNTYRVSDPLSYDGALAEWTKLDDLHCEGRLPHVKFFEVRTVLVGPDRPLVGPEITSHDRYDGAPLNLNYTAPVVAGSRGYAKDRDAARAAWKAFAPTFRSWWDKRVDPTGEGFKNQRTGTQGQGGWFYYPNGVTVAQGLDDLAAVCKRRNLVVRGVDGRWYVVDLETL